MLLSAISPPALSQFIANDNSYTIPNYNINDRPWLNNHFLMMEDKQKEPNDKFVCLIRNELLNDTCTDNAAYWRNIGKYGAISIGTISTLYNPIMGGLMIGIGIEYSNDVYNQKINDCQKQKRFRDLLCEHGYG